MATDIVTSPQAKKTSVGVVEPSTGH